MALLRRALVQVRMRFLAAARAQHADRRRPAVARRRAEVREQVVEVAQHRMIAHLRGVEIVPRQRAHVQHDHVELRGRIVGGMAERDLALRLLRAERRERRVVILRLVGARDGRIRLLRQRRDAARDEPAAGLPQRQHDQRREHEGGDAHPAVHDEIDDQHAGHGQRQQRRQQARQQLHPVIGAERAHFARGFGEPRERRRMHLVREQRHRDRDRDELPDDARHAPPDPRARGERQREREVGQPQRLQMAGREQHELQDEIQIPERHLNHSV